MHSADSMMNGEYLSTALFRETRGHGFFRVISGVNAPFYLDILDTLEYATADRPEGLAHEEVISYIIEALEQHPHFDFSDDGDSIQELAEPRDKARAILSYLLKNHWLDEPIRRDWRRMINFDAHGVTLIQSLRKIAWPDAAVFTDKIAAACSLLFNEKELSEKPWSTVEICLANIRDGLAELQTMQKSIQRFTKKQLDEHTLKGNLAMVFDDYAEQMSHACYSELVRARLPTRLPDAVMRISDRLMTNATAYSEMQVEVLRRHPEYSADKASFVIGRTLDELIHSIERILPMADEIDKRAADFVRRSLARFRYLQDITGEKRNEIKTFFEKINQRCAGQKPSQIDIELPPFRLPSIKVPGGADSLYRPPSRRKPSAQDAFEDSTNEVDRQDALDTMGSALKESLSVHRANTFVKSLKGTKGSRIACSDLELDKENGITDLISLLLHAESKGANYRLDIDRVAKENAPPALQDLTDCQVETFSLVKK